MDREANEEEEQDPALASASDEPAAEDARRLELLLEASDLLASSLDYATILEQVAAIIVPRFGDGCVIDVVEQGALARVAVTYADPSKRELAERLKRLGPPDPHAPGGILSLLRAGRAEVVHEVSEATLRAAARDAEHLEILRALAPRAVMFVPLRARGTSIGAIWVYSASHDKRFVPRDVALVEDIARRAALAIDNARLYREAQEAVRARDVFMAVAAHELRTPLTSLRLHVQTLQRGLAGGEASAPPLARITYKIDAASQQIERLVALVENVFDVSRLGAGQLELTLDEVDLGALVREVTARFEPDFARAGCTPRVSVEEGLSIRADRTRLSQVVGNLVGNAIKYGKGAPIEVAARAGGRGVIVSVKDGGIGVAPADQARIFERFERAVSERHYGGLGVGLWVARQLVEAHGGAIRVESEPGRGATFIVELPR